MRWPLLGRAAYGPSRRRPSEAEGGGHGIWRRVAALVDRAPRKVRAATLAGPLACAACAPVLESEGVPLDEIFVADAPSVAARETLGRHFPAGPATRRS